MTKKILDNIKKYQCAGCVNGPEVSCYKKGRSLACDNHIAGTRIYPGIGKVFLGLPTGFNRLGRAEHTKIHIFQNFEECEWNYDIWNIPVWKHFDKHGNTIVRGICPRINDPWIHIFLEDCLSKINCLEITRHVIDNMD